MPGADRYPLLLSPLEIRGRRLRNRIVSTPHATGWSRDGLIDQSEVDYHVRKAAGGCGLVMTFGSASVDPSTEASYGSIALWDERNEPALRALADGVHAEAWHRDVADDPHGSARHVGHLGHPVACPVRHPGTGAHGGAGPAGDLRDA